MSSSKKTMLFEPLAFKNLTVGNRIWVAPMCQYMAEEGMPNDWHHVHLAAFANGGFGLVMTEATAVCAEGRTTPNDTGIWNAEQVEAWSRIVRSVQARGSLIGVQLGHAGRKASAYNPFGGVRGTVPLSEGGWETVAPSAEAFGGYSAPVSLSTDEIQKVVDAFAAAASRAAEAGFDVIEVHAAHGYLLHQFLSPLSNIRTDGFGGSLQNRARALIQVVRAVRLQVPAKTLFVRLSATDWEVDGLSVEEISQVAAWLRDEGVDLVDVSTGGNTPNPVIPVGPSYQVPAAREVRKASGMPVSAVGLITSAEQAEAILQVRDADAIMLGRAALTDPYWPLHAAMALDEERLHSQQPHSTRLHVGARRLERRDFDDVFQIAS